MSGPRVLFGLDVPGGKPVVAPCGRQGPHLAHVWSLALIDGDYYWCEGVATAPIGWRGSPAPFEANRR